MPWSVAGSATVAHATAANFAFTWPAGLQAGDVAFLVQYQESDTEVAVTTPVNWTVRTKGSITATVPDGRYLSWSYICTGSETGTASFTHASVYRDAAVLILRPPSGTATPVFDVTSAAVTSSATSPLNLAAITLTAAGVVFAGATSYSEEDVTAGTSPFVVGVQETSGASGGGAVILWAEKASGTTGIVALTYGTATANGVGGLTAFKTGAASAVPAGGLNYYRSRNRVE